MARTGAVQTWPPVGSGTVPSEGRRATAGAQSLSAPTHLQCPQWEGTGSGVWVLREATGPLPRRGTGPSGPASACGPAACPDRVEKGQQPHLLPLAGRAAEAGALACTPHLPRGVGTPLPPAARGEGGRTLPGQEQVAWGLPSWPPAPSPRTPGGPLFCSGPGGQPSLRLLRTT